MSQPPDCPKVTPEKPPRAEEGVACPNRSRSANLNVPCAKEAAPGTLPDIPGCPYKEAPPISAAPKKETPHSAKVPCPKRGSSASRNSITREDSHQETPAAPASAKAVCPKRSSSETPKSAEISTQESQPEAKKPCSKRGSSASAKVAELCTKETPASPPSAKSCREPAKLASNHDACKVINPYIPGHPVCSNRGLPDIECPGDEDVLACNNRKRFGPDCPDKDAPAPPSSQNTPPPFR